MKIAIAQLYTKNLDDWAYIAVENKKRYARLNNYDLVSKRGLYKTKPKRHPSWHSLSLILEILETSNIDWVFWSDVDALIMDYTVKLESFMKPNCDIIIPWQGQGEYCGIKTNNCLCCGHYFIKNTQWSKDFLRHLWKWPKDEYDRYRNYGYWEQCGMNYMFNENEMDFDKHVYIEPKNRAFNSFYYQEPDKQAMEFSQWGEGWFRTKESEKGLEKDLGTAYNEGDFIVHFAGKHCIPQRKKLMQEYSEKIKWN